MSHLKGVLGVAFFFVGMLFYSVSASAATVYQPGKIGLTAASTTPSVIAVAARPQQVLGSFTLSVTGEPVTVGSWTASAVVRNPNSPEADSAGVVQRGPPMNLTVYDTGGKVVAAEPKDRHTGVLTGPAKVPVGNNTYVIKGDLDASFKAGDVLVLYARIINVKGDLSGATIANSSTVPGNPRSVRQPGDINNSGTITSSDALLILKIAVGSASSTRPTVENVNCSVDGYGKPTITASDALIVLRVAVGSLPQPIVCPTSATTTVTGTTKTASSVFVAPEITIKKTGTGSGVLSPVALNVVNAETVFGLKATPAAGSVFAGWSGVCTGKDSTCQFTTNGLTPITLTARFDRVSVLGAALGFLGNAAEVPAWVLVLCGVALIALVGNHFYKRKA